MNAALLSPPVSPGRRIWLRFRQSRRGYWSLIIFLALFAFSLVAELVSNDRPLIASYHGQILFPVAHDYSEKTFGGDFDSPADYLDPFIQDQLHRDGNWAIYPLNRYRFDTLNYFAREPNPAPPSSENWLGTDDRGRDVFARLLYGFRISILFGLALTVTGVALGLLAGAAQGYFAGRTDLFMQRILEIWGSMPELYLLIIFASIFEPSIGLLLVLLSLFGWMGLSDYVRADFLRNRLTPVVTFLPFRMSGAILALTSLDFLGLGVPPSTPSLGELLAQGKNNLDAWWIALSTFIALSVTLLLLTNIGDALRNALDV